MVDAAGGAASGDFGGLGDAGDGAETAAAGGSGGGAARGDDGLRRGGGDFFGAGAVVAVGVVAGPGRVRVVFGFEFGVGLLLLVGGEPGEVEVGGVEEAVPFGGGGDFVGGRRRGGHWGGGEDGVVGLRGGDSHDVGWAGGREAGCVVDPVVVLRVVLSVSCWGVVVVRWVVWLEPALLPNAGHAGW